MRVSKIMILAGMILFSVVPQAVARPKHHHRYHHHRHQSRRYQAIFPFSTFQEDRHTHSFHHSYNHQWFNFSGSNSLVSIAKQYIGKGKFTRFPGPWCRDALNVWLHRAGLYTDGDRRAADVRRLGPPTSAAPGVIGYKSHHTGVVAAVSGNTVWLISGNHSHRVQLSPYPKWVLHYVRPQG